MWVLYKLRNIMRPLYLVLCSEGLTKLHQQATQLNVTGNKEAENLKEV
jgi:hypothetical protein